MPHHSQSGDWGACASRWLLSTLLASSARAKGSLRNSYSVYHGWQVFSAARCYCQMSANSLNKQCGPLLIWPALLVVRLGKPYAV